MQNIPTIFFLNFQKSKFLDNSIIIKCKKNQINQRRKIFPQLSFQFLKLQIPRKSYTNKTYLRLHQEFIHHTCTNKIYHLDLPSRERERNVRNHEASPIPALITKYEERVAVNQSERLASSFHRLHRWCS